MADKNLKVTKSEEEQPKPPPVRWNHTVNSGWYISNEVFRRIAHTGEFAPKEVSPDKKPAEPRTAPST